MKKTFLFPAAFVIGLPVMSAATPSTEYWTAATTDIQPYGIGHIGIDNYFTVFRKAADGAKAFPTDVGYTVGVLPFSKLQLELGIDLIEPTDYPILFNAKFGIPENAFFKGQPSLAAGIFNVGTQAGTTDFDITYAVVGKALPVIGRLFVGGYIGNSPAIGGTTNKGITVAWDRAFLPAKSANGADYSRLVLAADWATGTNAYGGGGPGVYYYFNENISLLTGPVFFNDTGINGKWKWTTQLDINFKTW